MALQFIKKKIRKTSNYIIVPHSVTVNKEEDVEISIPQENDLKIETSEIIHPSSIKHTISFEAFERPSLHLS